MSWINYTEPGTEQPPEASLGDPAVQERMKQLKPGILQMLSGVTRTAANALDQLRNLSESKPERFGGYLGAAGTAAKYAAKADVAIADRIATDPSDKLRVKASELESEAAKTPPIPQTAPLEQRIIGGAIREAPDFVAQVAQYAAAGTMGPLGIAGLGALQESGPGGRGALKGSLRALAQTAVPSYLAVKGVSKIADPVIRRLSAAILAGGTGYYLSDDPTTGALNAALAFIGAKGQGPAANMAATAIDDATRLPGSTAPQRALSGADSAVRQMQGRPPALAETTAITPPPGAAPMPAVGQGMWKRTAADVQRQYEVLARDLGYSPAETARYRDAYFQRHGFDAAAGTPLEAAADAGMPRRVYSIGLDKFNGSNAKEVIRQTAEHLEATDPAHGTPRTWADNERMARDILPMLSPDMTVGEIGQLGEHRALASPQLDAVHFKIDEVAGQQQALIEHLQRNPGDDAARAALTTTTAKTLAFMRTFGKASQETGRAQQILQRGMSAPAEQLQAVQRALPDGAPVEEVVNRLIEAPNLQTRVRFMDSLMKVPRGIGVTIDNVFDYWVNALLSGPQTTVMNTGTNVAKQVFSTMADQTAAATVGATKSGISRLRGRGPALDRVYYREIPARVNSLRNSWANAGMAAAEALKTGEVPEGIGYTGSKLQQESQTLFSRSGANVPAKFLTAQDTFAKVIAQQAEKEAITTRERIRRGLSGDAARRFEAERNANPTPAQLDQMRKFADSETYTSPAGPYAEKIQGLRQVPGMRWIITFYNTLNNITKDGLGHHTPLALAPTKGNQFYEAMREGGAAQDLAIGKVLTGSTLAGAFGAYLGNLVEQDRITGGVPSDPSEKAEFWEKGKTPYAVKVLDPEIQKERHVNFGRFQPFGMVMGTMVDTLINWRKAENEDEPVNSFAAAAVKSLRDNIISQTGFTGALQFTQMVEDPVSNLKKWENRLAGSFVPAALRQIARSSDVRQPGEGPAVVHTENMLDAIQEGLPRTPLNPNFNRETLPQKMGPLTGAPQTYGEPLGGNFVSPNWASLAKDRPLFRILDATDTKIAPPGDTVSLSVDKSSDEARRILREVRKSNISPRQRAKLDKLLSPHGLDVKMDPEDYQKFQGISGDIASHMIEDGAGLNLPEGVTAEQYLTAAPKDMAQKWISDTYEGAHRLAKDRLGMQQKYLSRTLDDIMGSAKK